MQLYVLKMLFSKLDYHIETARNGFEAYELAQKS
jgi:CheY-like chemotaxis protein